MAIASKTFSVTSYEYGNYQSSDGNTNKAGIVTTIYWRIAYTDDSSTPQTVNVEGALAFDPSHIVQGTADPRTGAVNNSVVEWEDLNDTILSGSVTAPLLFESPLFILSTNSIPLITFPNTVYCLSKNGAGLKHIKN